MTPSQKISQRPCPGVMAKVMSSTELRPGFLVTELIPSPYLEGQGDLISSLITPITHIVTPVIPIVNLLTKSP